ncbi:MAG: hypothetical protein NUV31_10775, partial [Dehalococcoidales bacterium]|nr:hypothetical protein [Dehalococcoidales bacterium]
MFSGLISLFCILLTIIAFTMSPAVAEAEPWNTYQLTDSTADNANIDVDVDSTGTPHAVYERNGNIYYKRGIGNEELVAAGRNPAIAVGSDGVPWIAFIGSAGGNWVTARAGGNWQAPVNVSAGNSE